MAGDPPVAATTAAPAVEGTGTFALHSRRILSAIQRQRRACLVVLVFVYLPSALFVAVLALGAAWKSVPFPVVASDPATLGGLPFYAGVLSNSGVIVWSAAAAISLFAAAVVRLIGGDRRDWNLLLASGAFVTVLLFDDLFLLHEAVFPRYLGVPQEWVLALYAVAAVVYIVAFSSILIRTDFLILLSALGAPGVSAFIDQLPFQLPMHLVWEDGAKLLGTAGWLAYLARTSTQALARASARQSSGV